jgi:hypothetical protein
VDLPGSSCSLFTSENKEDFGVYHGSTVSKVCRTQGTTKFILLEEIREKIGSSIADVVFDE